MSAGRFLHVALLTNDLTGHMMAIMDEHNTITSILKRWPSRRSVYEDVIVADPNLDMIAVHRWFQRGSVPPKYDIALIQGAARRGIGLHSLEIAKARAGHPYLDANASPARQRPTAKPAAKGRCA